MNTYAPFEGTEAQVSAAVRAGLLAHNTTKKALEYYDRATTAKKSLPVWDSTFSRERYHEQLLPCNDSISHYAGAGNNWNWLAESGDGVKKYLSYGTQASPSNISAMNQGTYAHNEKYYARHNGSFQLYGIHRQLYNSGAYSASASFEWVVGLALDDTHDWTTDASRTNFAVYYDRTYHREMVQIYGTSGAINWPWTALKIEDGNYANTATGYTTMDVWQYCADFASRMVGQIRYWRENNYTNAANANGAVSIHVRNNHSDPEGLGSYLHRVANFRFMASGLATATPENVVDIVGRTAGTYFRLYTEDTGKAAILENGTDATAGGFKFYTYRNSAFVQRVHLNSYGMLLIGDSTVANSLDKFRVRITKVYNSASMSWTDNALLAIENNTDAYIQFAGPTNAVQGINFGANAGGGAWEYGKITYSHGGSGTLGSMAFGVNYSTTMTLNFVQSGDYYKMATIGSSGNPATNKVAGKFRTIGIHDTANKIVGELYHSLDTGSGATDVWAERVYKTNTDSGYLVYKDIYGHNGTSLVKQARWTPGGNTVFDIGTRVAGTYPELRLGGNISTYTTMGLISFYNDTTESASIRNTLGVNYSNEGNIIFKTRESAYEDRSFLNHQGQAWYASGSHLTEGTAMVVQVGAGFYGFAVRVIAGETIVAGNILACSTTTNRVKKAGSSGADKDMPCGIAHGGASTDGVLLMIVAGFALVKVDSGVTVSTTGGVFFVHASTAGEADWSSTAPVSDHWREVGHNYSSSTQSGLYLTLVHFN